MQSPTSISVPELSSIGPQDSSAQKVTWFPERRFSKVCSSQSQSYHDTLMDDSVLFSILYSLQPAIVVVVLVVEVVVVVVVVDGLVVDSVVVDVLVVVVVAAQGQFE